MARLHPILCSGALARPIAIAVVLASLAACGQRGRLYMPNDPAAANRPTLPQILIPGVPGTATQPTLPTDDAPGNTGTGTANPVRTP